MKKVGMTKGMLLAALIVGGAFNTAMAADKAATTEGMQGYELDQVVVTASRMENKKVDTPANVTVVDNEKIVSRGYRNVAEALEDVAGARVSTNGTSTSEKKIVLNGDDRVIVMVDGKRLNYSMGSASDRGSFDLNTLPPINSIERVEVVKGAAGTLYGSDAVGGVVNVITKKINQNNGSAYVGFGSQGGQEYGVTYAAREGKTGVMVSATRERQSEYKYKNFKTSDVEAYPGNDGYDQKKVSLKLDHDINDDSSIGLNYDYSAVDGFTNARSYTTYAPYAYKLDKKVNNVALQYNWGLSGENLGFARVYRNYLGYENSGRLNEATVGIDIQQETVLNATNKLVYGASWYDSKVDNTPSSIDGISINNKALFVQDQWKFAPSWQANVGVRYDDHSKAGSKTTMSAAVNKKFNEDSNAYLSWGQVFKAPTVDDMFYNDGYMFGNPNLSPETGDVWTIGYNVNTSKATTLGVSAYYSKLSDAIKWANGGTSWTPSNVQDEKKRGLELTANHKLNDNFDLEASYTYAKVEDNNNGAGYVRDANVTPNMYRFGVRYHNDLWNVDVTGRGGSGADASKYLDSKYLTMDINAKYKVTKDLSAYLKLYNLNNSAYVETAGYHNGVYDYPMQSRRFMMGMEYKF